MLSAEAAADVDLLASHELDVAAGVLVLDPGTLVVGLPPSFLPYMQLGVDGLLLGWLWDAPEFGPADRELAVFETTHGSRLVDAGIDLRSLVARRIMMRHDDHPLLDELGPPVGEWRGFRESIRRERPAAAPVDAKWRLTSDGNGVLAARSAWGIDGVRRPQTVLAGLEAARQHAPPALALYLAQQTLVLANAAQDAEAAATAYSLMVDPLAELGRPTSASRAAALSTSSTGRDESA